MQAIERTVQTLTLDIAGHQITVRSPAEPAYVENLARDLDSRIRSARDQGAGPIASVLLTALGLADELARTRSEHDALRAQLGGHAETLRAAVLAATHE